MSERKKNNYCVQGTFTQRARAQEKKKKGKKNNKCEHRADKHAAKKKNGAHCNGTPTHQVVRRRLRLGSLGLGGGGFEVEGKGLLRARVDPCKKAAQLLLHDEVPALPQRVVAGHWHGRVRHGVATKSPVERGVGGERQMLVSN